MSIKEYKLGEICNYISGKSLSNKINKDEKLENWISKITTNHRLIKTSNIKNGTLIKDFFYIKNSKINDLTYIESNIDDLLLVLDADVGSCCINNFGKLILTAGIIILYPNENIVLKKYMKFYFEKSKKELLGKSNGTTIKHLSKHNLLKYTLKLPDIEIQQQIIDIIEPFEKMLNKEKIYIDILNNCLIFISNYISTEDKIHFLSIVNFCGTKYRNQKKYIDTSNISKSIIKGY